MSRRKIFTAIAVAVNLMLVPVVAKSVQADTLAEGRLCACGKDFQSCCIVDADKCNGCVVNPT